MNDTNRQPTIRDVAARAGVSHQTVSRVINHHPAVRDTTRERVIQAATELNWSASEAARALRAGHPLRANE